MNTIELSSVIVLSCPITINSSDSLKNIILDQICNTRYRIKGQSELKSLVIFTPNPEQLVFASQNKWFKNLLLSADINLPDGIGDVVAIRLLHKLTINRISGVDFIDVILETSQNKGFGVGLIGGREKIALSVKECLSSKYPKCDIKNIPTPNISEKIFINTIGKNPDKLQKSEKEEYDQLEEFVNYCINSIKLYNLKVVFVGLGAPKQEILIDILRKRLDSDGVTVILMAVGGAFDMISGNISRAPRIMQRTGLEWLYRLIKQPWRIKRQLSLISFIYLLFKEYIENNKKNKYQKIKK